MSALKGMVICQTGTMSVTRKDLEQFITDNGGVNSNTVTNKTTHLVCSTDGVGTAKHTTASNKGISIISEDDLRKMVAGGGGGKKRAADPAAATTTAPPPAKKGRAAPAASAPAPAAPAPPRAAASSSSAASLPTGIVRKSAREMAAVVEGGDKQKLVKKGNGVVDIYSNMQKDAHVYEEGSDVYQCTLNQTNIGTNNNKFYILQLLEADAGGKWWVWTRWARVGQIGQSKLDACPTLASAKAAFNSKFRDKTRNEWSDRANFEKVPGKYHLMDMDYSDAGTAGDADGAKEDKPKDAGPIPESKLPQRVQDIIGMITDTKAMTKTLTELHIDVKKMPLGKISKTQIKQGYEILKQISDALKAKASNTKLVDLSSQFYTIIPHDFGMRVPPVINTDAMVTEKIDMLDTLADLEIASKLLGTTGEIKEHPLDSNYHKIKCEMVPLDKDSDTYKMIVEYVKNTHGETHTAYTLEVLDVLEIKREGEEEKFTKFEKLENRQLLWHGSRLTNFMGILSQGLRIAPPEAPVTGYMFGKGVYFADMVTKSANYCHSSKASNIGMMILSDVALGKMCKFQGAKYMEKPVAGFDSTMGEGRMMPNPAEARTLNGVHVPCGKCTKPAATQGSSLLYNEFIVYDVAQIKMKFLLKVKFHYKF